MLKLCDSRCVFTIVRKYYNPLILRILAANAASERSLSVFASVSEVIFSSHLSRRIIRIIHNAKS